jgi:hypothetical protein
MKEHFLLKLKQMPKTKYKKKNKNKHGKLTRSHEPHSKFLKRVLAYLFFGVLTILLTTLVYYRAKGYTFTSNGEVVRRGIVLVDSAPVSAKIFLNNKEVDKTEAKLEVPEGQHNLKIQAEGYRTWERSFSISSQEVKWFFYPYLIPEVLNQEVILENLESKTYSKLSPNGRVVAAHKAGGSGVSQTLNLELLNLREEDSSKITSPLIIPSQIFSRTPNGEFGQISFIEWSPNSDSILLEHKSELLTELINVRVGNPVESLNLSRSIPGAITEVHYDSRSRLFILAGEKLSLYNPKTLQEERVVSEGVLSFQNFADEKYIYTKQSEEGLGVFLQDGTSAPIKLNTFLGSTTADLDYKYIVNRRTGYVILTNSLRKELYIYKNPLETSVVLTEPAMPLEPFYLATFKEMLSPKIKNSPTGSPQPGSYFILQLSPTELYSYNLEEEDSTTYNVNETSATQQIQNQTVQKELHIADLAWIDSQRVQIRSPEGNIYYLDFDGNYLNLITNTNKEFSYFIKSKNKTVVVSGSENQKEQINQIKFKQ